jgi:hypothetical protein
MTDFKNMKRNCEGYCGGKYPITAMTQVGEAGARMCFQCADKARGNRVHDDRCPTRPNVGHVCANIECPECDTHGYHPTTGCEQCGHALCWCVEESMDYHK